MCPLEKASGVKLQGCSRASCKSMTDLLRSISVNAALAPINIALFVCVHACVKLGVVSLSLCLSFKLCKLGPCI